VSRILQGLAGRDVRRALDMFVSILPDHMNQSEVDFADSVKVTAAGFIHLRVLSERFEYLYGVLTVTPISDSQTALEISEYLRRENQMDQLGAFQQVRAIESFLEYLRKQFAHLKAAYPEFGNDRAGAAYAIKQIDSAVRYFRNPTSPRLLQNYLDD
jgi:hypothetical protein